MSPDVQVQVRYRNGLISGPIPAGARRWEKWTSEIGESDFDIVSWRWVIPADAGLNNGPQETAAA